MANSDAIKPDDVFDKGYLAPAQTEAENLLAVFQQMEATIKSLAPELRKALPKGDPKSIQELKAQLAVMDDVKKAALSQQLIDQASIKTKKEAISLAKLEQSQTERSTKTAEKLTSAYAQLNEKYKQADKIARDLGAAHGVTSDAFIKANRAALAYRTQLDAIDTAGKHYTRTVGGYTQGIDQAKISTQLLTDKINILRGLQGPARLLGRISGLGEEINQLRLVIEHLMQGMRAVRNAQAANTVATEANTAATAINNDVQSIASTETELNTTATEANTAIHEANTAAKEAETAATEELALAEKLSGGAAAGVITALFLVGAALFSYIQRTREAREVEAERMITTDNLVFADEKMRKSHDETVLKLKEVTREWAVLKNEMSKVDAAFITLSEKSKNELREMNFDTQKQLQDIGSWYGDLASIIPGVGEAIDRAREKQAVSIRFRETQLRKDQADKIKIESEKLEIASAESIKKLREKYSIELIYDEEKRDKQKLKIDHDNAVKEITDSVHDLKARNELLNKENERYVKEQLELQHKFAQKGIQSQADYMTELKKLQEENISNEIKLIKITDDQKLADLENAHRLRLEKIEQERNFDEIDKKIYDQQVKDETLLFEQAKSELRVSMAERTRKLINEINNDEVNDSIKQQERILTTLKNVGKIKGGKITEADLKSERDTIAGTTALKNQSAYDELQNQIKIIDNNDKIDEQTKDLQKLLAQNSYNTKVDANNEARKQWNIDSILSDPTLNRKEKIKLLNDIGATAEAKALGGQGGLGLSVNGKKNLDEAIKAVEEVTKGIQEGLQKRSEIQQQADQRDIDLHTRFIDAQAKLAAGGKNNNLAEEEARQAKAEEKKLQDAKRVQRVQQSIAVFEAFTKTLQAALDKKEPFLQAFGEAGLASGVVSAALSRIISDSAFDGTEDTGNAGDMDSKGGKLWMLHPNERVLSKEQNAQLGGISNNDLVDVFKTIYTPNFEATNTTVSQTPAVIFDNSETVNELKKNNQLLTQLVGKPVTSTRLDALGEWTEEINSKNMRTIIHHKRNNSRPSIRLNG